MALATPTFQHRLDAFINLHDRQDRCRSLVIGAAQDVTLALDPRDVANPAIYGLQAAALGAAMRQEILADEEG